MGLKFRGSGFGYLLSCVLSIVEFLGEVDPGTHTCVLNARFKLGLLVIVLKDLADRSGRLSFDSSLSSITPI